MRLGNFVLQDIVGRGGMGEVWRAVHEPTGTPAAVKLDLKAPTPEYRAAFFHEVRLIAGLDHPACVQVLDAGVVSEADEVAAAGKLAPGAPWLAMELALGGALSKGSSPQTWDGVLHVLRALLEALRHAHARGVLHRDIKFGNLLLAGPRGDLATVPRDVLGARIVLSDFGIGHAVDDPDGGGEHAAGTPQYMAPEQIQGDWRSMGPWTDLYQVGILAWTMTTRAFPFRAERPMGLFAAHMLHKPPPYHPAVPVPDGLEPILRKLLAKEPQHRYRFASEVLAALDALPHPMGGGSAGPPEEEELPTISLNSQSRTHRDYGTPRPPTTGRPGTGLWGMRVLPLVGRDVELERLQIALLRVAAKKRPEVLALTGASGTGRSRLARGLREWAHTDGLGEAIVARHGARPDASHGLIPAISRYLRLDGDPDLRERAEAALGAGPYTDALIKVLGGERMSSGALHKTLAVALRAIAGRVPLVVVVEDVHHAPDTIAALSAILADLDARPVPILFVLTATDEGLAEHPDADAALTALLQGRGERLALGPLAEDAHRALVRSLLGLEGTLAETVERRSAGNPALAVQWVGHWVERGLLVPGPRGLVLAPGASAEPPGDLLDVWRGRLERLSASLSATDRAALWIAGILGHTFRVDTWRAACERAGIRPSDTLLSELLRSRLARGADASLATIGFAHGLLVEAIREAARASGRWEALHAACADAVAAALPPDPATVARLRLEAGQREQALEPLRQAFEDQLYVNDFRSDALLDRFRATLADLALPQTDPRWGNLWLLEAWLARMRGRFDDAEALARGSLEAADANDWTEIGFGALRELGQQAVARGRYEAALGYFHRAAKRATDAGRTEFAAHCVLQEGDALKSLGRLDDAREAFEEILNAFEDTHAWRLSHEPAIGLADVAIRSGRYDEAESYLELGRERATRARLHGVLAQLTNLGGEVARHRGDLDGAARLYAEAVDRFAALESQAGAVSAINLGLCLVLDGRPDEAAAKMAQVLREVDGRMPVVAMFARFVAWAAAAALGEWDEMDALHEPIRAFLDDAKIAEPDLALLAELAADRARAAGRAEPERQALRLWVEQLERLGRDPSVARKRLAER